MSRKRMKRASSAHERAPTPCSSCARLTKAELERKRKGMLRLLAQWDRDDPLTEEERERGRRLVEQTLGLSLTRARSRRSPNETGRLEATSTRR